MKSKVRYPKRLTVYVTQELLHKLEQLRDQRSPKDTIPDVVREALRAYVDEQEQIIGSRRHFQKVLREDIRALYQDLQAQMETFHNEAFRNQVFSVILTANGIAAMLTRQTGQAVSCETVLRAAAAPGVNLAEQVANLMIRVQNRVLGVPEEGQTK